MNDVPLLGRLLGCPPLEVYTDSSLWFDKRDEIKEVLGMHLLTRSVEEWLSMLQPADIWCAKVLNYDQLMRETGYKMLNMELKVTTSNGLTIKTTRCPIRIDGQVVFSSTGAPLLGEHNERIDAEFRLIS
jgi:crotonobetainyl-CoA:carnitine CoA-transferase CaiB-like acyl-CoA transferase